MDPPVKLYNIGLSKSEFDSLLEQIRSTSYIDEVESGEEARESSPLFNEIQAAEEIPKDTSIQKIFENAGKPKLVAIADKKFGNSVLIIERQRDGSFNQLYVAPKDVIEVSCNCRISNMSLSEFKSMAEKSGSEIYDSQR